MPKALAPSVVSIILMSLIPAGATPVQGILAGLGLALSTSLLIYGTGRVFGVSGFIHRAFSIQDLSGSGWTNPNRRLGDVLAVSGLVVGGIVIGSLEQRHHTPDVFPFQPSMTGLDTIKLAAAGFLVGLGSKLQNGCTSGHMLCGISRYSWRSIIATSVFYPVASLTSQLHRHSLPHVGKYDWSIGPLGAPLLGIQALLFSLSVVILVTSPQRNSLQPGGTLLTIRKGSIIFLSSFMFSVALRMSTLNFPTKVLSFLITPFRPRIFDPTWLFTSIAVIPASAILYQLAMRSRRLYSKAATPASSQVVEVTEQSRLVQRSTYKPSSGIHLPILDKYDKWPSPSTFGADRRLLVGAVLFGVGWGLEGICPGPALINLGRSIFRLSVEESSPELSRCLVWLLSCVVGGFLAP